MKLVVINSAGPMGSSVLGAVLEKLGYQNLPVRKRGLHQYLMGDRPLSDNYFQTRTSQIICSLSKPKILGGTSVLDRLTAEPTIRADFNRVRSELDSHRQQTYKSIQEMYEVSDAILKKSITYKNCYQNRGTIEYTVDIETFLSDIDRLHESYKIEFDSVVFFHMHREFDDWFNSLVSQSLVTKKLRFNNFWISLSGSRKRHARYLEAISNIPGKTIKFEDLFLPKTQTLADEIAEFLGHENISIDENDWYDLYGQLTGYQEAFTARDTSQHFLNTLSKILISWNPQFFVWVRLADFLFLLSHAFQVLTYKFKN